VSSGEPQVLPYGSWPSPLTAERIVERSVSLGEVFVGADDLWWAEQRPDEGGRVMIVRHRPGGEPVDVLPEGYSARTRVHEYGGGAWWLHDDVVFFANATDQRLHRIDGESVPRALTPAPAEPGAARYADGVVTPDGRWVICVRELHETASGEPPGEPVNELVAVHALDGGEPTVLVHGPDFVSFPRVSPDGTQLCWTQWHHPDLPWDRTELWVADLDRRPHGLALANDRAVAGHSEVDESVFQPSWTLAGDLLFVSDRHEWWNLYRIGADQLARRDGHPPVITQLTDVDGEIGVAQWVFGQSRYAVLADGRILCAVARDGRDRLMIVPGLRELDSPFTSVSSLRPFGAGAAFVGGSPTGEPVVVVADVPGGDERDAGIAVVRPAREVGLDEASISRPEPISFPTTDGAVAHGLFYRPTNPAARGPAGDAPPLVVLSHGGPTGAARPQLNLTIQYWTSRGLAVVDVNYRGSTGYGRSYRRALYGHWGIVDVDDCIAATLHLVAAGEADAERLVIRGTSAGGYTTLCALTFRDTFRAGASLYGVGDLDALVHDSPKFEVHSLDALVGPYPEARDRYRDRSPIHQVDRLACPLIVFQGLDDPIVRPAQAEMMVAALRTKGIPFAYLTFEGEQHGFRRAANIRRVLEAELYFYARILGFELADAVEPVPIENL
jgi:dipeptidyl aminopeptidase/acylaminoacyl peptidase